MNKLRSVYGICNNYTSTKLFRHRTSSRILSSDKSWKTLHMSRTILSCRRYSQVIATEQDFAVEFQCNVREISKGDKQVEDKVHKLLLEMHSLRKAGEPIPLTVSPYQWEHLLMTRHVDERKKLYKFLVLNKENQKARKAKNQHYSNFVEVHVDVPFHMDYRLGSNSLFLKLQRKMVRLAEHTKLFTASQFNPPFVIDCSYGEHMDITDGKNCGKQLTQLFTANKEHPFPLHLVFCNVNKNDIHMKHFHKIMPDLYDPPWPFFYHEESYLDLFPKERLVYLSPHCGYNLQFDSNDIYIIGAFTSEKRSVAGSLIKAKSKGLRVARVPFHLNSDLETGRTLSFPLLINIMCDMYLHRNWDIVFSNLWSNSLIK